MGLIQGWEITTHEDAVLETGFTELTRRHADIDEDVIGVGIGHLVAVVAEETDYHIPYLRIFPRFPGGVFLVFQRGERGDGAQHVHVAQTPGCADSGQSLFLTQHCQ